MFSLKTSICALGVVCVSSVAQGQDFFFRDIADVGEAALGVESTADGRLLVFTQRGRIRVIEDGQLLPDSFLDIDSQSSGSGERGLLGMALHPNYSSPGMTGEGQFFVHYSNNSGDAIISRFDVSADPNIADAASETQILFVDQPCSNHNGGSIDFGPDGYLYIFFGDGGGGNDSCGAHGQRLDTLLGAALRIDVDNVVQRLPAARGGSSTCGAAVEYSIPGDNPFVGVSGACEEIWAFGLRNPFRASFDRDTGDLWIGDVGQGPSPAGREEIDFQPASSLGGENYGWSCRHGTQANPFTPLTAMECADMEPFVEPVMEVVHGSGDCAIIGGVRYRGPMPQIYGDYFFSDSCSSRLYWATFDTSWSYINAGSIGGSPGGFGEGPNGELYVVTLSGDVREVLIDEIFVDSLGD